MAAAGYAASEVPEYQGNPLIEALPPIRRDDLEVMQAMSMAPIFSAAERELDAAIRRELVSRLNDLFIPLPPHFQLLERLSTSLRRSYTWRNPMRPQTPGVLCTRRSSACRPRPWQPGRQRVLFISSRGSPASASQPVPRLVCGRWGLVLLSTGCIKRRRRLRRKSFGSKSVVRKTGSSSRFAFRFWPQRAGALGGEARYTIELLDDPRMTTGNAVTAVMKCLANHHVGILVIDEVQNLFSSKRDR